MIPWQSVASQELATFTAFRQLLKCSIIYQLICKKIELPISFSNKSNNYFKIRLICSNTFKSIQVKNPIMIKKFIKHL